MERSSWRRFLTMVSIDIPLVSIDTGSGLHLVRCKYQCSPSLFILLLSLIRGSVALSRRYMLLSAHPLWRRYSILSLRMHLRNPHLHSTCMSSDYLTMALALPKLNCSQGTLVQSYCLRSRKRRHREWTLLSIFAPSPLIRHLRIFQI